MHQIQKQIIEIELPEDSDSLAWNERITNLCGQSMSNKMASILDGFSDENTILIDKIEIDLGEFDGLDFEQKFFQNFELQFSEKLSFLKKTTNQVLNEEEKTYLNQASISHFDTFLFFLENGFFLWHQTSDFLRKIETNKIELFSKDIFQKRNQVERLIKILKNEFSRKRLIQQFSENRLWQFLETILFEENQQSVFLKKLYKIIAFSIEKSFKTQDDFRLNEVFFLEVFYDLKKDKTLIISELNEVYLNKLKVSTQFVSHQFTDFEKTFAENIKQEFDIELTRFYSETTKDFNQVFGKKSKQKIFAKAKINDLKENKAVLEDGIYIENAGLVLLFPFLKEFLKACKVANDDKILDKEAAVHLLQYLINFKENSFENDLVLNKILCGIPINFPLKRNFQIQDFQDLEANSLLNAVLKYWSVLKNTSIEGLQGSFLQRSGKLTKHSEGWLLQVEPSPFDMLLGEIPWSYNVISFVWMNEAVFVEWYG